LNVSVVVLVVVMVMLVVQALLVVVLLGRVDLHMPTAALVALEVPEDLVVEVVLTP
jgi:DNA primase